MTDRFAAAVDRLFAHPALTNETSITAAVHASIVVRPRDQWDRDATAQLRRQLSGTNAVADIHATAAPRSHDQEAVARYLGGWPA